MAAVGAGGATVGAFWGLLGGRRGVVLGEEGVGCGDFGERRVEGVVGDFLGVDLDVVEERLVEEAAFGRVGLEIGGLDAVGQVERDLEGVGDGGVVDLVAAEKVVGSEPFAADPGLLFRIDVVADLVVVVRGQEFPLFVIEPGDLGASAARFLVGDAGDTTDVCFDGGADAAVWPPQMK